MRGSRLLATISLAFLICSAYSLNFLEYRHYDIAVNQSNNLFDEISVSRGYSTDLALMSTNDCYTGESMRSGQIGSLDFSQSYTYNQLITTIGVTLELSFNFLFFKFSVYAEYTREITETSFRTSFNFLAKSSSKNFLTYPVGEDALTPYGKEVYNNNRTQFGLICGDKIFKWYETGSLLMLSVVIEFESKQEKNIFGAGVKYSTNFSDFEASARATLGSFRTNGKLKVIAKQIGGDPSALKRISDMNDSRISCTFRDLERCLNFGNEIIKYINTDYPNQLKNNPAAEVPLGTFETDSIDNLGLRPPKSFINIKVKNARKELGVMLENTSYYSISMQNALSKYPQFSGSGYESLKSLEESFTNDFNFLKSEEGAQICWSQPQNCVSKLAGIKNQVNISEYDDKLDSVMSKLLYTIEFNLYQDSASLCSYNKRKDNYSIRILPLTTGNYAFTVNSVLVDGSFNGSEILVNARNKFPNLSDSIKINYSQTDSYYFEASTVCSVNGQNISTKVSGRKFRSEYYVLSYRNKDQ